MRQRAIGVRLQAGILGGSPSDQALSRLRGRYLGMTEPRALSWPDLALVADGRIYRRFSLPRPRWRMVLALATARAALYGPDHASVIEWGRLAADEVGQRSLLLAGWILSPDPGDEGTARRCPLTLARQMHVPVAFAAEWRDLAIQESEARRWWHGGSGWLRLLKEGAAVRVREYSPIQVSTGAC